MLSGINRRIITKDNSDLLFGIVIFSDDCIKLAEDFRYIFSERLSIGDMVVYGDAEWDRYDCYICCTYDRKTVSAKLHADGLRYKTDYYFAEDLFYLLDDWKGKKIAYRAYQGSAKDWIKAIIFGYSAKHGIVLPNNPQKEILKGNYINNGGELLGNQKAPGNVSLSYKVIYAWTLLMGVFGLIEHLYLRRKHYKNCDYLCFHSASDAVRFKKDYPDVADKVVTTDELNEHTMASLYFNAVYYDRRQNDCGCIIPFNTIWIGEGGMTRLCDCPEFLNIGLGKAGTTDCNSLWNSPLAKIIRLSVINNTYTFCSRVLCGKFSEHKDRNIFLNRKHNLDQQDHPGVINVANDSVCNLNCPSCRIKPYVKNSDRKEVELEACKQTLQESLWLEKADTLIIGGGGETFFSKYYKDLLYGGTNKRHNVTIMTNGVLFTPDVWNSIEDKYEHISLMVSVDAATRETYEKIRRGGNYERLMKNMDYLSTLRKENKVDRVIVNMIVQRANYEEIPDFIRWAQRMGFDEVNLSHIRNWGTYSAFDFDKNISMFDKNGRIKKELAQVLEDPICNDPIVNMKWHYG
ncbi:MAG: radical SAM protein [Clostridiales bacterium]|nr:radical SAM protein [Clostridiales bacterium]